MGASRKGFNMDCLFCKIANGDIPSSTLYEDEDVRVILDINPAAYGHALVLPKSHVSSALEADDKILAKTASIAKRIGQKQMEVLGAKGVNLIANCGAAAGQTIDHFHIHVIPRYENDSAKDGLQISQTAIEAPDFEALAGLLSL